MLRTWDLSGGNVSAAHDPGQDAEVFAHADISPDGQQVAYSWLDDRPRGGSGSPTPSPETRRRPPGCRCRDSNGPAESGIPRVSGMARTSVKTVCMEGHRHVLDPPQGKGLRSGSSSAVTHLSGRWRTSTGPELLVGDSDGRTLIVDAETLNRGANPSASPPTTSPRSGTEVPRWSTSLPPIKRRCAGG
jgi:hypothetical protein